MKPLAAKFRRALLTWAGLIALFVAMQLVASRDLASGAPPEIQGRILDGQAFAGLASLPKPAVIYFWASWCSICRAMQDTVGQLGRDAPVLTVALQSGGATEVGEYMKKSGFEAPTVLDEDGSIAKAYGVRGVPAVFVLGADGGIRYATTGYTSGLGLRLRLWLAGF
jgi:thiol-disulfide isomerase/thioredoxin